MYYLHEVHKMNSQRGSRLHLFSQCFICETTECNLDEMILNVSDGSVLKWVLICGHCPSSCFHKTQRFRNNINSRDDIHLGSPLETADLHYWLKFGTETDTKSWHADVILLWSSLIYTLLHMELYSNWPVVSNAVHHTKHGPLYNPQILFETIFDTLYIFSPHCPILLLYGPFKYGSITRIIINLK
jgi:hypothetical protein